MNENHIFDAISAINDDALQDAKSYKKARSRVWVRENTEETAKSRALHPIYKRLIACAAIFALVIGAFSMIGFDNVYAAVRQWLSFIPGFGIQASAEQSIFVQIPIVERTEGQSANAQILRGAYCNGTLSVTVHIDGKAIYGKDFSFYVNGEPYDVGSNYSLAVGSGPAVGYHSAMLDIAIPMDKPGTDDLFEIEITGFEKRLAFKMKPCQTYAQLCEIGPTVTKNGITLTVTANRVGNELIVWCYETREEGATSDSVLGYGSPVNGAYTLLRYIETESGPIQDTTTGLRLTNRFVYRLEEGDHTATLHIPYLSMFRKVQADMKVSIPLGYKSEPTNVIAKTDLGVIRVISVERTSYEHDGSKDKIMLELCYESNDPLQKIYSFEYDIKGNYISAIAPDGESGTTKWIEVIVDKDTDALEFSIGGIYYYLMDEYEFELDIQ